MIKVIDHKGDIVPNTYLTESGGLVVKDKEKLNQYLLKKNKVMSDSKTIDSLTNEVSQLREMVRRLLETRA